MVLSAAQSLKVERNPWAVISLPILRIIIKKTIVESGFFADWLGKTNRPPSDNSCARFRISMQREPSGIRYFLPAFIRSAGIVQALSFKSISGHSARMTSLVRVAVNIRNSKASRVDSFAPA